MPAVNDRRIFARSGTLANPAKFLSSDAAVQPLRDVHARTEAFKAESEAKKAELDEALAAAVEVQDRFDSLVEQRNHLRTEIAECEGQLGSCKARMEQISSDALSVWRAPGATVDMLAEHYRHAKMAEWFPPWIEQQKAALAEVEKQLAAMSTTYKIAIPA